MATKNAVSMRLLAFRKRLKFYNEKGEVINKGESILKDYQMLVRWIKKNVPYQQIKKKDHYIKGYINDELKELEERGYKFTLEWL